MKQLLAILLFAISFSAAAQSKADSLKQVEINKTVDKIINTTPIKDFQVWLYDAVSAKKYNDFLELYKVFINFKFEAVIQKKGN